MKIVKSSNIDKKVSKWNDQMYEKNPTPYDGFAGLFEKDRVKKLIKLANIKSDESILEVGCEGGNLLKQLPKVKRIAGLDISEVAMNDANKLCNDQEIQFYKHDAMEPLPFEKGDFNVIICSEVLEHVKDPMKVLNNIHSICSSETRFLVSIPIEAVNIFIKKILNSLGLLNILFKNVPQGPSEWHLHDFSKKMLLDLIEGKFTIIKKTSVFVNHHIVLMKKIN